MRRRRIAFGLDFASLVLQGSDLLVRGVALRGLALKHGAESGERAGRGGSNEFGEGIEHLYVELRRKVHVHCFGKRRPFGQ